MTKISEDRLSYQMSTNPQTLQNLLQTKPQTTPQTHSQALTSTPTPMPMPMPMPTTTQGHQQKHSSLTTTTVGQTFQHFQHFPPPSQQHQQQQQQQQQQSVLPTERPSLSPQKSKQDYFTANSADKYRSAMDIFNTIQNKPIVRIFFESYCSDEDNVMMTRRGERERERVTSNKTK